MADEIITETTESMDDYKAELESSFRKLSEGDIITGTVIAVSEEDVTLDLKYYAPGIIKAEELSSDPDFNLMESVHVGDVLEATIIRMDDGEGNLLLSRKEANDILAWDKLNQYLEDETVLHVRIKGIVPSGVIAMWKASLRIYPCFPSLLRLCRGLQPMAWKRCRCKSHYCRSSPEKISPFCKTGRTGTCRRRTES